MPSTLPNPYTPRSVTTDPVGRERVIGDIEQVIAPMLHTGTAAKGGVVLYGVRGIGKTSILRAVRTKAAGQDGFVTAWASVAKRTPLLPTLPAVLKRALIESDVVAAHDWSLTKFGIELGLGPIKTKAEVTRDSESAIWDVANVEQLLRSTARLCAQHGGGRGSGLLLFIDELHAVSQSELAILLNALQNIADDDLESSPFMFLGAGLPAVRGIATMAATFGERTLFREVTRLSAADARTALTRPASALGVTYDPTALEILVEKANGFPFFVQLYGYNAWRAAMPERGSTITQEDALAACELTEADVLDLFNSRFDAATRAEREFIMALAAIGGDSPVKRSAIAAALGKPTDGISMVRRALIAKAIITEEKVGFVRFTLPGFADFVNREVS